MPEPLLELVDDYYHFATIGSYEIANANGQALLQGDYQPQQYLDAFREIHSRRDLPPEALDRRLVEWQGVPQLSDVATRVSEKINEGRRARATDPAFIAEQVERLSRGQSAFEFALTNLRNSGEYAVPTMVQYLLDPDRREFHASIRQAMVRLGLPILNPLLASLEMRDAQVKSSLIRVIGEIGYAVAVPYLLEQVQASPDQQVRQTAQQSLQQLGFTGNGDAAQQYLDLSRKFYYNQAPIQPNQGLGLATVWSWGGDDAGLVRTDVPPQIFNEIQAMRTAGNALALGKDDATLDEALALWLASNYRREGELGEGEQDRTRPADSPSAGYYGTQAGVRYLQMVLERAETDRRERVAERRYNAADVALRAVESLQEVVGRGNIGSGETPLTRAMNFPDRRVRIESAFALAQSLPTQGFSGQEQVVPLLAEALSQTGEPSVLVVSGDADRLNATAEALRGAEYRVNTAGNLRDATAQAAGMTGVDVVVIDTAVGDLEVDQFLANAAQNPKLSGSAKLMIVTSEASRYEQLSQIDPTIATTTRTESDALAGAVEEARESVGGLPLDSEQATELALRSGELLRLIGTSNSVFNLSSGEDAILAGLDDERPEVRKLAGEIVALLDSPEAQPALLDKALEANLASDVRVSLFDSLAESAKIYGNRLAGDAERLLNAAASEEDLDVRAAAAEAVGALNLPADQARRLIIEDTATAEAPGN